MEQKSKLEGLKQFQIEIIQFNDLIKNINDLIDGHSQVIEKEKLKALGKRNQLYEEIESRSKREQELKVLIREKKEELERLKYQTASLLKIETEQKIVIEKLSFGSYAKKHENGNWLVTDDEVY